MEVREEGMEVQEEAAFSVRKMSTYKVGVVMRAGPPRIGPPRTWSIKGGPGWPVPHKICGLIFLTRPA